ncbi:benzoate/H(+) symporter BenE family transporter [Williamsia maris]|uniref:Benzoate membrane transport protein n=1 Tax=Williamsia maris TaxID=72806 RepID=A0ABT1HB46_9NOCA|nr:benzoate/H(+) symporter BenE family transporter [Williamsia maris]MCP2175476.1 benzoate membrane transport protein [Williamsia maris]
MPDNPPDDVDTVDRVGLSVPIGAGVVSAVVGFTSSFTVVLAGLRAVGASPAQAASGLLAVCLLQAVGMIVLSLRHRIPVVLAWSTPGAALLATTGVVAGGWPAAVGAFVVVGVLIVITGLWSGLSDLIGRIPMPVAQAMLAGVLLPLCLAPVTALAHDPAVIAPILLSWLVLLRWAPRWAVPGAFGVAAVVIVVEVIRAGSHVDAASLVPQPVWTMPHWTFQAVTGLAIPLYIVTMAAQNVPGVAIMTSFGYRVPWRASMSVTGLGTVLGAGFGGHVMNLAAISAALAAGPQADPDRGRRWVAAVAGGVSYLVLGAASAAMATLVVLAPAGVVQAVAGVALLATLGSAIAAAVGSDGGSTQHRTAAVATFVVAASGTAFVGIGSAFWALVVGIVVYVVLRPRVVATSEH